MPNNWIVDDIHELANDILLQSQGGDVSPDMSGYVGVYNTGIDSLAFASGNPIEIYSNINQISKIKVVIVPKQRGSGTPSPTNVRPITGRTSVDVTRTGKNLLGDWIFGEYVINGEIENRDARYHARSPFAPMGDGITLSLFGGDYIGGIGVHAFDSEGKWVRQIATIYTDNITYPYTRTFLPNENDAYIVLSCYSGSGTGGVAPLETCEYQIELGTIASAYEPYTGQSVTVNLEQTVYGGILDVTTGELTVETANIASYNGESIGEPWWSSMDEYVAGTTPTTGAQVVYTLATPTTVTLTPAQLALLEGYNIISTSADDLEVTYKIRS